jgi:preprotein translocase subunit SecD
VSRSSSRPQARRQRWLVASIAIVVVVAFGSLAATLVAGWSPRLGLDLAGGLSVVYQPAHTVSQADLDETVSILTNRVDALGVSGAEVSTQGQNIVVSVPGVNNARAVLATIGQTAQLYFRPVLCYAPKFVGASSSSAQPATAALPACGAQYQLSAANLNVQPNSNTAAGFTANQIPPDPALANYRTTTPANDNPTATVLLPGLPADPNARYLTGPSQLTGHAVKSAQATQNQLGQWVVDYTLTSTGSAQWDQVAQANFHQVLAIELDGVVQSAPIIQPNNTTFSSFQGQGEISGSLNQASAQNLALAMNFGALPVRLTPLTTQTISPTLGKASLQAGLAAGIAGLVLVLLYTILYYRALGFVIVSGMAVTAALLWAIVSGLGHTSIAPSFTLAGVTGLIVSIGITVDSYIVYFERLKDETRAGRTVRTSVDRGFKSAWRTVLAADLVSLIAAAVLYWIAIGDVRGFAFFLGLSTLLDIGITWFYTRPLVIVLGRSERVTSARHLGISRGLAIDPESAA